MDEPFGALDPITRENLQDELKKLQDRLKKTIVFVTHDMDEALKLGDRVVLMRQGRIVQADSPEDLLRNPADEFVEEFIGRDKLATKAETLTVEEVTVTTPITAYPDMGLAQATRRMRQKRVDTLVVIEDDETLVGVVTARDIQRHKNRPGKIADIVQRDTPVIHEGSSAKAAFVGGGGLGGLIVTGLRMLRNHIVLAGAVPAALLALLVDFLLSKLEEDLTPEGIKISQ
jgi:osmoprotectant transport system ATP-binding protein